MSGCIDDGTVCEIPNNCYTTISTLFVLAPLVSHYRLF